MRIGLDFDNTIVCYDKAIALLAEKLFDLPEDVNRTKVGLRNHLRACGLESEWTAFQGELYGPGMRFAQPFDGALDTMKRLVNDGHDLVIVSHRTCRPYAGKQHDLHAAAKDWIDTNLDNRIFRRDSSEINFLESREEKIRRIKELGCEAFLDDLPEVLEAKEFPSSATGILFNPHKLNTRPAGYQVVTDWEQLSELVSTMKTCPA